MHQLQISPEYVQSKSNKWNIMPDLVHVQQHKVWVGLDKLKNI